MICKFQIGQKVVCVGDFTTMSQEPWAVLLDIKFPASGAVYTIREMRPGISSVEEESVGLLLEEIENPTTASTTKGGVDVDANKVKIQEISFDCSEFEPLHESKADISVFRSLLTPAKQPEVA